MSKSGTHLPAHGPDALSPHELARRQAIDREARERRQSWQDVILDALVAASLVPADIGQTEADHAALDAVRHLLRDWQAPTGSAPLVERAAQQAAQRLERELPALVAQAVEQALSEAEEEGG